MNSRTLSLSLVLVSSFAMGKSSHGRVDAEPSAFPGLVPTTAQLPMDTAPFSRYCSKPKSPLTVPDLCRYLQRCSASASQKPQHDSVFSFELTATLSGHRRDKYE